MKSNGPPQHLRLPGGETGQIERRAVSWAYWRSQESSSRTRATEYAASARVAMSCGRSSRCVGSRRVVVAEAEETSNHLEAGARGRGEVDATQLVADVARGGGETERGDKGAVQPRHRDAGVRVLDDLRLVCDPGDDLAEVPARERAVRSEASHARAHEPARDRLADLRLCPGRGARGSRQPRGA